MSWITVVWSINAGACLALAAIYPGVWCKQRESWVRLVFSGIALAAGAIAVFELQLIHAHTSEEYGEILRWRQVPVWVLVVSLVGFARLYLHAGRSWLGWSACGLKTLTLILNFDAESASKLLLLIGRQGFDSGFFYKKCGAYLQKGAAN
jgi:two-component system, LuxR family, sensor kinase FixL